MYTANRVVQGIVTIVGLFSLLYALSGHVVEGLAVLFIALIVGFFFWSQVN